jgi:hypothetical protein
MLSLQAIGTGLLALASFTSALVPRQENVHGPNNRQYWSEGFDVTTEFAEKWPDTGNVVKVCTPYDSSHVSQPLTPVVVLPRGHP